MAVHAAAGECPVVGDRRAGGREGLVGQPLTGIVKLRTAEDSGLVSGIRVAVLAQEGRSLDQQIRLVRAVRRMAVQAAFADRKVLPQQRAALLRVAVVASLVDRNFLQQLRSRRAVRVVAVGANHLRLANRMVRELVAVGTLLGVAGEALLGLGGLDQDRVLADVDGMAAGAGHVVGGVLAALPVHAQTGLVAAQAHRVLHRRRRGEAAVEQHARGRGAAGQVLGARSVAGFAAVLCHRCARVALSPCTELSTGNCCWSLWHVRQVFTPSGA